MGWIHLGDGTPANGIRYQNNSASDYGVNHDGLGNLSGLAYGANIGWINARGDGANGAVILMHLGTERRDDFPHEKLEAILSGLMRMGYQPVKVSELMTQADAEPARAAVASSAPQTAPQAEPAAAADTPITK